MLNSALYFVMLLYSENFNVQGKIYLLQLLGEKRGIVKQTSDLVEGKLDIGEGFDVVAGQTMIAAGGALGAKSFTKTVFVIPI